VAVGDQYARPFKVRRRPRDQWLQRLGVGRRAIVKQDEEAMAVREKRSENVEDDYVGRK